MRQAGSAPISFAPTSRRAPGIARAARVTPGCVARGFAHAIRVDVAYEATADEITDDIATGVGCTGHHHHHHHDIRNTAGTQNSPLRSQYDHCNVTRATDGGNSENTTQQKSNTRSARLNPIQDTTHLRTEVEVFDSYIHCGIESNVKIQSVSSVNQHSMPVVEGRAGLQNITNVLFESCGTRCVLDGITSGAVPHSNDPALTVRTLSTKLHAEHFHKDCANLSTSDGITSTACRASNSDTPVSAVDSFKAVLEDNTAAHCATVGVASESNVEDDTEEINSPSIESDTTMVLSGSRCTSGSCEINHSSNPEHAVRSKFEESNVSVFDISNNPTLDDTTQPQNYPLVVRDCSMDSGVSSNHDWNATNEARCPSNSHIAGITTRGINGLVWVVPGSGASFTSRVQDMRSCSVSTDEGMDDSDDLSDDFSTAVWPSGYTPGKWPAAGAAPLDKTTQDDEEEEEEEEVDSGMGSGCEASLGVVAASPLPPPPPAPPPPSPSPRRRRDRRRPLEGALLRETATARVLHERVDRLLADAAALRTTADELLVEMEGRPLTVSTPSSGPISRSANVVKRVDMLLVEAATLQQAAIDLRLEMEESDLYAQSLLCQTRYLAEDLREVQHLDALLEWLQGPPPDVAIAALPDEEVFCSDPSPLNTTASTRTWGVDDPSQEASDSQPEATSRRPCCGEFPHHGHPHSDTETMEAIMRPCCSTPRRRIYSV